MFLKNGWYCAGWVHELDTAPIARRMLDEPVLVVSDRGRVLRIPVADVLVLKAEQKYVTLRTAARSHVLDDSLAELEQKLAALQKLGSSDSETVGDAMRNIFGVAWNLARTVAAPQQLPVGVRGLLECLDAVPADDLPYEDSEGPSWTGVGMA